MPLASGEKLGPYEITGLLGKGGMGEVYRATDTRLHRDVAIKVSAEKFSDRFEKEARAVAALNHRNICTLYDVGPNYLVMELVEGETLAERIKQGAIPLDESLAIGKQIADALEAAHEKGITHRDLKPANVKITPEGTVKVLDFGLAKIAEPASSARSGPEHSPTLTLEAATRLGTVMGTAGYMAPEQAKGRAVDKRADIWPFGVVLYEMVTGKRLFQGEDLTEILASVVKDQPDLRAAPAKLRRLPSRCLEKDPKRHLRDIGDAWELLEQSPPAAAPRLRAWLPWAVASVCLLVAAVSTLLWSHVRGTAPDQRLYFDIAPPPGTRFVNVPALSPDGQSIAFVANSPGEVNKLYVRRLDAFAARGLPGTEGALFPFWSPDGRSLGFTTRNGLKRIDLAGGSPQALYELALGSINGTWNRFGDILFFATGEVIQRISEVGGPLTPVSRLDKERGEVSHRFPQFLPDGKRFLFFVYGAGSRSGELDPLSEITGDESSNTVELATLGSFERKTVLRGVSAAVYARAPGGNAFLLYVRNNALVAQSFDESAGKVLGEPRNIATNVRGAGEGRFMPCVSVSPTGVLVYNPEGSGSRLAWFDRQGRKVSELPAEASGVGPSLSPDGKRLAVYRVDRAKRTSDIWITDLEGGITSRFTFLPQGALRPVWSSDGKSIAFADAEGKLSEKNSDGSGEPRLLVNGTASTLYDWSPDGRYLLAADKSRKMWLLDTSESNEGKTVELAEDGRFSPDGRFITFAAHEGGAHPVYVIHMPPGTGKWQIAESGRQPSWRRDGKELYSEGPQPPD